MDETTTLLVSETVPPVEVTNPNDPAEPRQKKLTIRYSNGESDNFTFDQVVEERAKLANEASGLNDERNIKLVKIALYDQVIAWGNEELAEE